jgi:hypothetical protein
LLLAFLAGTAILTSCASGGSGPRKAQEYAPAPPAPPEALTREAAVPRARALSDLHYRLFFALPESGDEFSGKATIRFSFRKALFERETKAARKAAKLTSKDHGEPALELDFHGGSLTLGRLNPPPGATTDEVGASLTDEVGVKSEAGGTGPNLIHTGYKIKLPLALLREGANTVELGFRQAFSIDSDGASDGASAAAHGGWVRSIDPRDGKRYVFSHLGEHRAQRLFPCFDQLDLKARIEVSVQAPAGWTVLSTERESEPPREQKPGKTWLWKFPETRALSPGALALHAGPFVRLDGPTLRLRNQFPTPAVTVHTVRVFFPASLAPFRRAGDWIRTAARGIELLGAEWGYAFPHAKLDLVFVPELQAKSDGTAQAGPSIHAAGAVVIDRALAAAAATPETRLRGDLLVLGHVARAWLGDLATPRWWNGAALTEGLAAYGALRAAEEPGADGGRTGQAVEDGAKKLSSGFRAGPDAVEAPSHRTTGLLDAEQVRYFFYTDHKSAAYARDRGRPLPPPVDHTVPATHVLGTRLEPSAIAKGAAVFRQLAATVGEDELKEGIHRFLLRFAGKNFAPADLIAQLGEASGGDLSHWARHWLRSPGVDHFAIRLSCAPEAPAPSQALVAMTPAGEPATQATAPVSKPVSEPVSEKEAEEPPSVVQELRIERLAEGDASEAGDDHRPHRQILRIASRSQPDEWETEDLIVSFEGRSTELRALVGKPCPELLLPNVDDSDYSRVELNDDTVKNILEHPEWLEELPFISRLNRHQLLRALRSAAEKGRISDEKWRAFLAAALPGERGTALAAEFGVATRSEATKRPSR